MCFRGSAHCSQPYTAQSVEMANDIYQSLEEFSKYHTDNDELNSQIILGLADSCQEEEIKNTLLHYSTQKDTSTIRKELNKVDINTLKNTADYLGLSSDYKTPNVITTKIVSKLTALMRCICAACSGYYNEGDTASLFCSKCSRPCHSECYKDSKEGLKPGITLVFTCYQCTKKTQPDTTDTAEIETSTAPDLTTSDPSEKDNPSDQVQPKHPVIKVIDAYNLDFLHATHQQASYPVCELYRKGLCPHGQKGLDEVAGELCKKLHPKVITPYYHDNYNENEEIDDADRSEDQRPMCRFFLRSRCKHGISGKDCRFQHKKVCRKFLNNGRHRQYGCNKGQSCDFFHVKMCYSSLNEQVCFKPDCRFLHIKGTRRYEENHSSYENQAQNNPENTNSSESRTNRSEPNNAWNPPSENPFLLITKQLSAQLAEMQRQQNFILNRIQMQNPQQLQPPQQVQNHHQPQPSSQVPPNPQLPPQVHRAAPTNIPTSQNQMQHLSAVNKNTLHQPQQPVGLHQVYYVPNLP